ncbi:MAG: hypothetical protein JXO72_11655 [Vicinamibacteria bacterium]|nr:hypothetical protein [Vicinamibacteria bacterium]
MVKGKIRSLATLAILLIIAMGVVFRVLSSGKKEAKPVNVRRETASSERETNLPRIHLARLDAARGKPRAVSRDVFEYGRPPAPPTPEEPPEGAFSPPPITALAQPLEPTPLALPPLNVRYIGAVQTPRGVWFAALLTDGKELLTGKEGDVLASRFEIVKIGHESLDVREVASGNQRRIRLGGR